MSALSSQQLPPRLVLAAILGVSLAALAAAFAGQFLFGLDPCILCLYQRVPYGVAALLGGLGLLGVFGARARLAVALSAVVFATGAAIAAYHVGVEQHWWASITGCGGGPVQPVSVKDLRAEALASEPLRPCDQVNFRLLGLSLAGWNVLASTALATACVFALQRLSPGRAR